MEQLVILVLLVEIHLEIAHIHLEIAHITTAFAVLSHVQVYITCLCVVMLLAAVSAAISSSLNINELMVK